MKFLLRGFPVRSFAMVCTFSRVYSIFAMVFLYLECIFAMVYTFLMVYIFIMVQTFAIGHINQPYRDFPLYSPKGLAGKLETCPINHRPTISEGIKFLPGF